MKKWLSIKCSFLVGMLISFGICFSVSAFASSKYEITDLGTLGGSNSYAYGINDSGQVVGWSHTTTGYNRAFLWENNNMIDLGSLTSHSYANAINNSSQIIGLYPSGYYTRSFLWENSEMIDIGTLGGHYSYAYGMNDSCQVVGGSQAPYATRAFLWDNGVMTNIGTLGGFTSYGIDINNFGQVVGWSGIYRNAPNHAFFWENGVMSDIGTLGGLNSYANGINDNSRVIGYSDIDENNYHAFFWENGVISDIGTLDGLNSCANGINDFNQIVGSSGAYGFLWEGGTMLDLNDLLFDETEWIVQNAQAINNYGQIVGYGTINGEQHAFLMTPNPVPEPSSILLFGSGLLVLLGFRKKKKV